MLMPSDLTQVIKATYDHLKSLEMQIEEGVQTFNNDNLTEIINLLKTDSNNLARKMHQKVKVSDEETPVDAKLRKELLDLIFQIQHHGDFSQALGHFQNQLLPILDRIKSNIGKWMPKVEKAEMGPYK
jgi:hypothetical protein